MDACLIILAGGSGERIKYFKPILKLHGETIIEIILKKFIDKYDEILMVIREEWQKNLLEENLNKAGINGISKVKYVFDSPLMEGPLAAIHAGTLNSNCNVISILPSDTPFINPHVYVNMMKNLNDDYEAVVPIWPNGFLEPLISIYLKNPLIEALNKISLLKERRVQSLLKFLRVKYIDIYKLSPNPELEFFNINTWEDFEKALEIMEGKITKPFNRL